MAPGPIPRSYALQSEMDELQIKVKNLIDSMDVLADVIKILSIKIYGGDEDIEKIYKACLRKVEDM